jgi:hypothetical protein
MLASFHLGSATNKLRCKEHSTAPWSRVLEKLTVPQLVKKFPEFYGNRRFITAFTKALSLS